MIKESTVTQSKHSCTSKFTHSYIWQKIKYLPISKPSPFLISKICHTPMYPYPPYIHISHLPPHPYSLPSKAPTLSISPLPHPNPQSHIFPPSNSYPLTLFISPPIHITHPTPSISPSVHTYPPSAGIRIMNRCFIENAVFIWIFSHFFNRKLSISFL